MTFPVYIGCEFFFDIPCLELSSARINETISMWTILIDDLKGLLSK